MTVTVNSKTAGLVVPPSVRRQAGIRVGDRLEFKVSSRKITIVAKPPVEVDEYTPAQRRAIDRGIAKGLEDVRMGRVHGPFNTVEEMAADIEARIAAAEYTPAQRRVIDRGIAKGLADVRNGRVHGPFQSADEMMRYLRDFSKKRKADK